MKGGKIGIMTGEHPNCFLSQPFDKDSGSSWLFDAAYLDAPFFEGNDTAAEGKK